MKLNVESKPSLKPLALEFKGFWLSKSKTEYMGCKFSNKRNEDEGDVKLDGQEIPQSK